MQKPSLNFQRLEEVTLNSAPWEALEHSWVWPKNQKKKFSKFSLKKVKRLTSPLAKSIIFKTALKDTKAGNVDQWREKAQK